MIYDNASGEVMIIIIIILYYTLHRRRHTPRRAKLWSWDNSTTQTAWQADIHIQVDRQLG